MRPVCTARSWDDYLYWQKNDKRMVRRVNDLTNDIQREPFEGIGKPEPLLTQRWQPWGRVTRSRAGCPRRVENVVKPGADLITIAFRCRRFRGNSTH